MTSLEIRRERGDLIEFYKAERGLEEVTWENELRRGQTESGPKLRRASNVYREKIQSKHSVRENFFVNRVIPLWNDLPHEVRHAETLNNFKNELDKLRKFRIDQQFK